MNVKKDFPIFRTYPELVYLDSAATSQKPQVVIDAVTEFYEKHNSNVHRGIHFLADQATEIYENTRQKVADLIHAKNAKEIIFAGNASEAINLAAFGYARRHLNTGDVVVTSIMEHHSNFVPWMQLKKEIGIELVILPIGNDYRLEYQKIFEMQLDLKKIKFVALSQASNVLGTINPIKQIISEYKKAGINAKYLVDAAQSIPHIPIDVQDLGCDFLAFSSHKMLGPSGVGVLWGKEEVLNELEPIMVGSHMIDTVTMDDVTWADLPAKLELGTGNLEGVAGLGAAIDYLNSIGMDKIKKHEGKLTEYALDKFASQNKLTIHGPKTSENRLGVFSFSIEGIHPHDVAEILNQTQICVRSGHHCAQPLMQYLKVPATARASIGLYNTENDIDKLNNALENVNSIFK